MQNRIKRALFILSIGIVLFSLAPAESGAEYSLYSREGSIEAGLKAGLTVNPPIRFDIELNSEYYWRNNISFGLDVDIFFRGPTTFTFIPFAQYHFDIDSWPKFVPYAGGGIGGEVNTNGNGIFDIMVPSFGFKWELIANRLFVGPDFEFHIKTNFDNTRPDFHILVGATYRF